MGVGILCLRGWQVDVCEASRVRTVVLATQPEHGKTPRWIETIISAADEGPGFLEKRKAAVHAIKFETSLQGKKAYTAQELPIESWQESEAFGWLESIQTWKDASRKGCLHALEEKMALWVKSKLKEVQGQERSKESPSKKRKVIEQLELPTGCYKGVVLY